MLPEDSVDRITNAIKKDVLKGWEKFVKYSYSLKLLNILIIVLILCFLLYTIISLVECAKLDFSLTSAGAIKLLEIFDVPIKILVSIFGILTLFTAIKRMQTSDIQVEEMIRQNRLSNFFKFREEFVKHFSASKLHRYFKFLYGNGISNDSMYYKIFYALYGPYNTFNGFLTNDFNKLTEMFLSNLIIESPQQIKVNRSLSESDRFYIEQILPELTNPFKSIVDYIVIESKSIDKQIFDKIERTVINEFVFEFLSEIKKFNGYDKLNARHTLGNIILNRIHSVEYDIDHVLYCLDFEEIIEQHQSSFIPLGGLVPPKK